MPLTSPSPSAAAPRSVGWTLASLSLLMLLPSLGTSIANVALPTFSSAFGASFQAVQWVVLAYLLATTTLVVSVGQLGDRLGRRRLLLAGTALFTGASLACAAAPTLALLIAARVVQGAGAAVMLALTMALVGQAVPKARAGSAMGLLGTMSAAGTALGPTLGGLLIAGFGWPAVFAINLPLGLLALALAWRQLPADPPRPATSPTGFDLPGSVLLALTLAAYALAVTAGPGRFGAANAALLAAAGLGAGLFVGVQARSPAPLVRLAMLRDRALRAALGSNALVSTVVMATLVVGPFYLARGLQLGTAGVGLVMSMGPLVAALTGAPAGRLVDRIGAHRVVLGGLVVMLLGGATLAAAPLAAGIVGYLLPLALVTAGYAAFQAANNTAVMADIAPDQRGVVSGLLTLSRNLGLITGASLMGAVFAAASRASGGLNPASASAQAVGHGLHTTFVVASALVLLALAITVRSRATPGPRSRVGSAA